MRERISPAALLVKVTAKMRYGGTPEASRLAMRYTMVRVFPLPAPANTRSGASVWVTASLWGSLSSLMVHAGFLANLAAAHTQDKSDAARFALRCQRYARPAPVFSFAQGARHSRGSRIARAVGSARPPRDQRCAVGGRARHRAAR